MTSLKSIHVLNRFLVNGIIRLLYIGRCKKKNALNFKILEYSVLIAQFHERNFYLCRSKIDERLNQLFQFSL